MRDRYKRKAHVVMGLVLGFAVSSAFRLVLLAAAPKERSPKPQYDAKGNLLRPADYRDWEFLSSGYGMNYSPAPGSHELFTTSSRDAGPMRNFSRAAGGRSSRCL